MTDIFHITHIGNLPSILSEGGLYCDNERTRRGLECRGIAYEHIKARRASRSVPACRGGTLGDYVPFYFAPRSPMLYAIHTGHVPSHADGQAPVVHLVSSVEDVANAGFAYAFTDGHADMAYSEFFDDLTDLGRIDWEIMRATYWGDTLEDGDRKRRRQAEFLVHAFLPWVHIAEIGVIDTGVAERVQEVLYSASHTLRVRVRRNWYY